MAAPSAFDTTTPTGRVPYVPGTSWLEYVKQVRAANPGMSYKDAMKTASKTYPKKTQKGGGSGRAGGRSAMAAPSAFDTSAPSAGARGVVSVAHLPGMSWMDHVKRVRAANPGMSYKEAMKAASGTYNK